MLTIVETSAFTAAWPNYWTPEEFGDFCAWLALNPDGGDVIPGSGGCRKVRWKAPGRGKRGGVRIIHFNRLANGEIWLLTMYAKNERASVPNRVLREILETICGKGAQKEIGKTRRTAKHR
jgi:hypothetical protein